MSSGDAWSQLALFESRDLVSQRFRALHGRALKEEKAFEIIAFLSQGREYFRNARDAADLVRPLLIYYGALSLARGLILFRERSLRASGLSGHGLSADGWIGNFPKGNEDSPNLTKLLDLPIGVTGGTFVKLCEVTRNREVVVVSGPGLGVSLKWSREGTPGPVAGTEITIREVVSRIPDVADMYYQTIGALSNCYRVYDETLAAEGESSIRIVLENVTNLDEVFISALFGIPPSAILEIEDHFRVGPSLKQAYIRFPRMDLEALSESFPPVVSTGTSTYVVLRLKNSLRLSSLTYLYLTSYFMGMLVRYFPHVWMSASWRRKGDFLFPLLTSAVSSAERRLPGLFLEALADTSSD